MRINPDVRSPQVYSRTQLDQIGRFLQRALPVLTELDRYAAGVTITSWWRDPGTNAAQNGHSASKHLTGLALDVRTRDQPQWWIDWLVYRGRQAGLIAIYEGEWSRPPKPRHVHLQV
jgi:uncharacterized protein YcbK (DUF882 family)